MNLNNITFIPDDVTLNIRSFILDPLSVIIKLAIISNKPTGTKLRITGNIIYLQEPGMFQAICRYWLNSNKTDIQYLYNPIEFACKTYLCKTSIQQNPKIKDLFKCAQQGLLRLIETYKSCSVMRICLNYYLSIISNHLDETHIADLFKKDDMTNFYSPTTLDNLYKIWTPDKIKIVLNLTTFLSSDEFAGQNVRSLETIMDGIDKHVREILC